MEEKVAIKKLLEVEERPYNHNTDPLNKMEEPSVHNNTLGSTHLTLSLNNSEQLPHQIQGLPLTQMGMLRIKLEEAKKENENLKAMLNQVNENCIAIQHRLLLAMQQHEQSSLPRNNHDLQMGNRQDAEKAVLSTRQFLNIGEPSPSDCSKTDGLALSIEKIMGKKLAYDYNIEGEINSQITSEETKRMKDQASEVTCRKARVAIRARSDFSLMGDGCQWRKYGQKTAKGNPCPRAYYRCSMGTACPVRKQVQRCFKDENVLMTTYEGKHNHPLPAAARPMANSTSAALNMFLSGSTTSLNGTSLSNSLFSSLSSRPSTAFASFSPSATCPTVTLDFTQPNNNYLQFQIATSPDQRQTSFPLPLHGYPQTSKGFNLSSNLPTFITPEKNLALVDVVSEAIAKDPSLKATLLAAISSLTRDPQNINNHSQPSKSGYDPCSKMPAMQPHQPYTPQLIER